MNPSLETYLEKIRRLDSKDVFFIAGTEKSGTTWLQMLLDHHPQARCRGEGQIATRLWPELRKALHEYSSFVDSLNQHVFQEINHFPSFSEQSIRAIQAFSAMVLLSEFGDAPETLAVGEKTPGHLRNLDRLKLLFPRARFVLICRDGRDIAVSGWYHLKRQYGEESAGSLPDYAARIAKVWRQDYGKAVAFKALHPEDCLQLRYEDLHAEPGPQLTRVLQFLGLDASPEIVSACVDACDFGSLSGGRERGQENLKSHFRKGIVGDWRNHFDADTLAMFDAEAGELLDALGYPRGAMRQAEADSAPRVLAPATLVLSASAPTSVLSVAPAPDGGSLPGETDPLSLARRLSDAGDWRRASEVLRAATLTDSGDAELWRRLGQALRAMKDFDSAASAYGKAVALEPTHEDALLMTAVSLQEAGQSDASLAAYQHLLALRPGSATGWSLYGVYLRALGRSDDAISALRSSLAISEDIPTHNLLVIALEEGGSRDLAIQEGSRVLAYKDTKASAAFLSSPHKPQLAQYGSRGFDHRKPARNIISFSLWGDDPAYVHGAIVNARIAPNLYYGWTTRFYCDDSVPADARAELQRSGAQIVMVEDPLLRPLRHLWRFLVSDDADVDWFVCRDTDSRLNAQELVAVDEWLRSGKPFHVMRDHVYHMELILAGMWGGMAGVLPNVRDAVLHHPAYAGNRFGDQAFLMDLVWPLIKDHALIHDSYYRLHGARDFPSGYRLPRPIHVGGAIKNMPTWRHAAQP